MAGPGRNTCHFSEYTRQRREIADKETCVKSRDKLGSSQIEAALRRVGYPALSRFHYLRRTIARAKGLHDRPYRSEHDYSDLYL